MGRLALRSNSPAASTSTKASDPMTLERYASFSNYAVASATIVLALAWLAYLAEWAPAGSSTPPSRLRPPS